MNKIKVDNAIIMAAGLSSRFVPLSLEKPKGLFNVKGEILIERQIKQLKEVGINNITIVVGYKKESFFYLEEKFGVKLVTNSCYNTKNNIETLYLVRHLLKNTYICSSDDYFTTNPFSTYEECSFYSAEHVTEATNEWYMLKDNNNNITKVQRFGVDGDIMLGAVFYDEQFSKAFIPLIEKAHESGLYDNELWEQLFADNINNLPPMKVKVYPKGTIFEFDSLDELRSFDSEYINNTNSKIMTNIAKTMKCSESEIGNFTVMNKGLTNVSFIFEIDKKKYVYRHPGYGTESIISRPHEKQSLEIAKKLNIDPTYIYMNEKEGWKISLYIENTRQPQYDSFEDSKRILQVLRNLHKQNYNVGWAFKPFEEAITLETLTLKNTTIDIPDFKTLKQNVAKCYKKTQDDGVNMCFCHSDTYAPNWMLTKNETILIDWEYAGNADPGCDIGCYIMDAMYSIEESEKFIKEYLQDECNENLIFHYLAYVAIVSYYWFVWALYRESIGRIIGESLHNWYTMAKKYSEYLVDKYSL